MPAKKKTYRKKTMTKAKKSGEQKWADRGATAGKIAYKALKLARRLKDAVNIEYKEQEVQLALRKLGDGSSSSSAVEDSVTFIPLCVPEPGVGENQRIGTSIKLQRLSGRGRISWLNQAAPSGGTVTASVRVILMRGKADAGKRYPITEDLLAPAQFHGPFLDTLGTLGAKYDNTKYDTKILYDKTYRLDIARVNNINLNWNFPLNWHQNFFESEDPEIKQQITNNGLYLGVVTDTGTSAKCEFIMNYTVTYTDD